MMMKVPQKEKNNKIRKAEKEYTSLAYSVFYPFPHWEGKYLPWPKEAIFPLLKLKNLFVL